MEPEDLEPQRQKPKPRDLDPMSIEALKEYVSELEAEIARVKEEIARKESHRSGAEKLFRR